MLPAILQIFAIASVNNWIVNAKIYDRCELFNEFVNRHGLSRLEAASWTCIAERQASYDTAAFGGSARSRVRYHGIFQISDEFWCSPGAAACGVSCENLRDNDLTDDLRCARKIYEEHYYLSGGNGFSAWPSGSFCQTYAPNYAAACPVSSLQPVVPPRPQKLQKYSYGPKIYDRCELAEELYYKHGFPWDQIATWVCIAKHESRFNTSAIGSGDYGLFQISELYWCGRSRRGKGCSMACSELLDADISDDVHCMRKIYDEHSRLRGDGFTAWTVYKRYCRGDVSGYVQGCFKRSTAQNEVQKRVTKPRENDLISYYLQHFNRRAHGR